MRVGVYGTARNEDANILDWLASTEGADVVAINDTGSTDNTYARLAAKANKRLIVAQIPIEPMFLSNALNTAMGLLPDDLDLIIRLDLDERLQPGWRDQLEQLELDGPVVVRPWFDHAGCVYRHTRIHSRHGFRWELPVHEVLVDKTGLATIVDVDITIEHHQDFTKDRSQVLGELEAALAADPSNQRMQHYLAREYTYRGMWAAAIPLLRAHVLTDAFPEERAESWMLLGDAYRALMDVEDVPARPYRQATEVAPERREGWIALADLHMQQANWPDCVRAAEHALTIVERGWYLNHLWAWNGKAEHLAALACWYLDRPDDALTYGRRAVELDPRNDLYVANLRWYERTPITL